ncbi:MAG: hypothetical protein JWM68_751 [Verrucomicrobiales bacterium]|nr:hypothetical protein [Verrucomicrobiales bacterium]
METPITHHSASGGSAAIPLEKPQTIAAKTPDQTVSASIAAALLAAELITAEDAKTLPNKMVAGRLTTADWSIMVKMGLTEKKP